jgi:hypothetical protein
MHAIPRFPNVQPKTNPRIAEIDTTAHAWAVAAGIVPADSADPGRWKTDRYGALIGHLFPDADFEHAVLWARWYYWWFIIDEYALNWELDDYAAFAARSERILNRGGAVDVRDGAAMPAALAELCRRTVELVPAELYLLLVDASIAAFHGMRQEIVNRRLGRLPRIDSFAPDSEYLVLRHSTFGTRFNFTIYEVCRRFVLPAALRSTPEWQDIVDLGTTVALLQNDIAGVRQDDVDGEDNNAVRLLELQEGLSRDEAAALTTRAIADAIERYGQAKKRLGEAVERLGLPAEFATKAAELADDIEHFSEGAQAWYLETTRYIGEQHLAPAPPTSGGALGVGGEALGVGVGIGAL